MFCKTCGEKLEEGAKFCVECGTPVEERNEEEYNDTRKSKKGIIGIIALGLILAVAVVIAVIFIQSGNHKYSGYYIYASEDAGEFVAMSVDKDDVTFYVNEWGNAYCLDGYLEEEEESAYLYLENPKDREMTALGTITFIKLADDSDRLQISIDKWGDRKCHIVSEEKYREFIEKFIAEDMEKGEGYEEEGIAEVEPERKSESMVIKQDGDEKDVYASEDQEESQNEMEEFFETENFTIYDQDGVTITLENVAIDEWLAHYEDRGYVSSDDSPVISIMNNNPDNKKLRFEVSAITFNGIEGDLYYGDLRFDYIEAGGNSSKEIWLADGLFSDDYQEAVKRLNQDFKSYPVETIGFYYKIQVGSDSELVSGCTILKTSKYQEGNLEKAYGEKICELEVEAEKTTCEVYYKQDADGFTVVLRNMGAEDGVNNEYCIQSGLENPWLINGKKVKEYKTYGYSNGRIKREGGVAVLRLEDTAEGIRKKAEIPNDEPIEIQMSVQVYGEWEDVIIPLPFEE